MVSAAVLCRRVDKGFKDYTATLLRELVIPREHLTAAEYDSHMYRERIRA